MRKGNGKINFNEKVINKIVRQSSVKVNPTDYLMKILSASRETAYRRIGNRIQFTVEETVTIAEDLGMSVDELLDLNKENNFRFFENSSPEPEDIYSGFIANDIKTMENLLLSKSMKIVAVINRIPLWLLPYKSLLKFDYCHYLYSIGKIPLITRYSDIDIPQSIIDLHEKASLCFSRLYNITCIVDSTIHLDIIKKIQYYSKLNFISPEDLQILQKELFVFLETYESLLRSGRSHSGSEYVFHYSYFPVESNIVFLEYGDSSLLQIRIYPENPVEIKKLHIIRGIQKGWIDSKVRNSVLITKTNDTQHIEMLRNAYQQVLELRIKN